MLFAAVYKIKQIKTNTNDELPCFLATIVGNLDWDIQSEICYIRFGDDAV